jgi:hypothetical protein
MRMKVSATAFGVAFAASVFTMATPADELSLDAAKTSAARGDMAALVSYAEALRDGWAWGLLYVEGMRLVDLRTQYSQAAEEKEPLMKHIRCVQGLSSQDLVTKALKMNPSTPGASSKVDTFHAAVGTTISTLCPSPSLEIQSAQHPVMNAWVLVVGTLVQGGGGTHVEVIPQATTNGHAFPTLNSCQVKLLEWEHKMSADGVNKNWYVLSCVNVFK